MIVYGRAPFSSCKINFVNDPDAYFTFHPIQAGGSIVLALPPCRFCFAVPRRLVVRL